MTYGLKHGVKLTWRLHVTGQEDRRLQLSRERLDVGLRLLVTVGNGEISAESTERLCASIGYGVLVSDMPRTIPFLPPRSFCKISITPASP